VTVIDGATNSTAKVAAGSNPYAVAVNPVTNMVYVANWTSNNVTVIDGATNTTTTVPAGSTPFDVAVNQLTNKIYVVNDGSGSVTVIDGATNTPATVTVGRIPYAAAVNPVTDKVYVANNNSGSVTVITEAPANDTKVRAAFGRLPGDTTVLARPVLTGKGVNRWTPNQTKMMGVLNRVGTAQMSWDWATVTGGGGTDSIACSYNWGGDSLIWGENFVCVVPLEDQAAITNNLGFGSPFAGNLEVYPVYRVNPSAALEEAAGPEVRVTKLPTLIRGVLWLPSASSHKPQAASLMDATGRKVMNLKPGANDVRGLAPGEYFMREVPQAPSAKPQAVHKIVIAR
jgi:YVTN family beta-propeller protein